MSAGPALRPGAPALSAIAAAALAVSVGLVLADSSVVTLALPAILREFDAGVASVAWVLIAFNLALAGVAVPVALAVRARARGAFASGAVAFAGVSLVCAFAPTLGVLVAARAAQGVLGAVVVAGALELLLAGFPRARAIGLWAAAGVLGGAVGPALGGVLTEAFSWQAMFALQAPVALLALAAARPVLGLGRAATAGQERLGAGRPRLVPLVALALVSAALAAALFLLVVMLIEGWRLSPARAALVVTAMPLAALVAGRWARDGARLAPALPGSLLLAGGLAALGLLPETGAGWTIVPQLAIGAGLGLTLGALIGVSVEGDGGAGAVAPRAAWTIAARHAGIVAGLLLLTPLFTADLDAAQRPVERAGLARVLDAPIALRPKVAIARALDSEIRAAADQQLPDVPAAFAVAQVPAGERADAARLRDDLEAELDAAATSAFSRSFLAAALIALLAAGVVAGSLVAARAAGGAGDPAGSDPQRTNGHRPLRTPSLQLALPAAATAATLLVAACVALGGTSYAPTPVADACAARARPAVERFQRATLAAIDGAACSLHTSREDLVRTLLDRDRPPGVSDERFEDALGDGIDRAEREGELGRFTAIGLRFALRAGGALGIVDRLLPR